MRGRSIVWDERWAALPCAYGILWNGEFTSGRLNLGWKIFVGDGFMYRPDRTGD